jgi:hypothetical protein
MLQTAKKLISLLNVASTLETLFWCHAYNQDLETSEAKILAHLVAS